MIVALRADQQLTKKAPPCVLPRGVLAGPSPSSRIEDEELEMRIRMRRFDVMKISVDFELCLYITPMVEEVDILVREANRYPGYYTACGDAGSLVQFLEWRPFPMTSYPSTPTTSFSAPNFGFSRLRRMHVCTSA